VKNVTLDSARCTKVESKLSITHGREQPEQCTDLTNKKTERARAAGSMLQGAARGPLLCSLCISSQECYDSLRNIFSRGTVSASKNVGGTPKKRRPFSVKNSTLVTTVSVLLATYWPHNATELHSASSAACNWPRTWFFLKCAMFWQAHCIFRLLNPSVKIHWVIVSAASRFM
jgi:hypothetical protein